MVWVPTVRPSPVPMDLLDYWQAALATAGFDYSQPDRLPAGGLLLYSSSDTADRLFDVVTTLKIMLWAIGSLSRRSA